MLESNFFYPATQIISRNLYELMSRISTLQNMSINLDHPKLSGETTVENAVTEVAAMVGENVKLRRGFMLCTSAHGVVSSYMHTCPQPGARTIKSQLFEFDEEHYLLYF